MVQDPQSVQRRHPAWRLVVMGLVLLSGSIVCTLSLMQNERAAVDYSIYPPKTRLNFVAMALLQYKQRHGTLPLLHTVEAENAAQVSWRWTIRGELDDSYRFSTATVAESTAYAPKGIRSGRGAKTDVLAVSRGDHWNAELESDAVRINGLRILCVAGSPLPDVAWTSAIDLDLERHTPLLEKCEWLLLEDGTVVNQIDVEIELPDGVDRCVGRIKRSAAPAMPGSSGNRDCRNVVALLLGPAYLAA